MDPGWHRAAASGRARRMRPTPRRCGRLRFARTDARGRDLAAGRRDALELALLRAAARHPDRDLVFFGDEVFDAFNPVWECGPKYHHQAPPRQAAPACRESAGIARPEEFVGK